jgi:hypothetical protein
LRIDGVDETARLRRVEPPVLEHARDRLLVGTDLHLLCDERNIVLRRFPRGRCLVDLHLDPLLDACDDDAASYAGVSPFGNG